MFTGGLRHNLTTKRGPFCFPEQTRRCVVFLALALVTLLLNFFCDAAQAATNTIDSFLLGSSGKNLALLAKIEESSELLLGLFTGVMMTAAIYMFFIWIVIRDRGQVFLMLFLVSLTVNMVSGNDFFIGLLDLDQATLRTLVQNFSMLFAYIFSIFFTYYFLEIDTNTPFMKYPLILLGVLLFLLLSLGGLQPYLFQLALPVLGSISVTVVLLAGLAALRLGVSGSLSHVTAFLFFFLSNLVNPLKELGYIDYNHIAFNLTNTGFALAAIMFAVVIAGQFAGRQEEKERALHTSNERFSLAMLGSNEGLFDWNLKTGEIYFSGQFRQLMGGRIEPSKRGLKEWLRRVQLSDRKILLSAFRKIRDAHDSVALNFEYRIRYNKDKRRWLHTKAVGARSKSTGKIVRIVGSIGDITQRKRGEVALKSSEQRFRSITEAHPVPVLIVRLQDERILYASPGSETLLGLPISTLSSHGISRFLVHADERNEILHTMMTGQEINLKEVSLAHGDGTELLAALSARRINYENEAAMVIGLYDLSERKKAEAQIAQQQEALQQSEKMAALGGLLAGVAHELNNPLSVVMGQTTLLIEGDTQPKTKSRAEKIFKAADRAARIIKSFLALARRKPPEHKNFDLNGIINNSLELLSYQFRNTNVQLVLDLADELPPVVGDSDQLTQVITNLALNAAQAMQEWEKERKITIKSSINDNTIRISIIDTGPGIPEKLKARVFEPFFTTKGSHGGTGVGLALCHNIIEGHGGHLMLKETQSGGATFLISLPASSSEDTSDTPDSAENEKIKEKKMTILIVDDEIELAQTLAELLEPLGHKVDLAINGAIALEKLRKGSFDAVISDLRMPVMDGPTLYKELSYSLPQYLKRIIYVTGDTLSPHVNAFLKDNPVPIIEKPYRLADVRKELVNILKENESQSIINEKDSSKAPPSNNS